MVFVLVFLSGKRSTFGWMIGGIRRQSIVIKFN
jgi:hypothetical protein